MWEIPEDETDENSTVSATGAVVSTIPFTSVAAEEVEDKNSLEPIAPEEEPLVHWNALLALVMEEQQKTQGLVDLFQRQRG